MKIKSFLRDIRDLPIFLTPAVWMLRLLQRIGVPLGHNLYQHFPYRGLFVVDVPGGNPFKTISRGTQIENGLYWEGLRSHEKGSIEIWMYLSRQSSTVLDIGANSGIFSLVVWACGSKNIHAFEPIKRIYNQLKSNFEVNGENTVNAWNVAISNTKGELELHDPGGECPSSASLSLDFIKANSTINHFTTTKVAVIDIDQFCHEVEINKVDLIKLDVEGHELNALQGMVKTITNSKPWLLIEVLDGYEVELKEFFDFNFKNQYGWYRINENDSGPNRNVLLVPLSRCEGGLPPEINQHLFPQELLMVKTYT